MAGFEQTTSSRDESLKAKNKSSLIKENLLLNSEIEISKTYEEWSESELSTFFAACRGRSKYKISDIVTTSSPAIINMKDKNGKSGISWACSSNNLKALQDIIQIGDANFDDPDNEGNTPLMLAAQAGFDEIVRFTVYYFRNKIEIDAENKSGFTALMKAALNGKTNCVRLLLIAGADVTKKDWGRGLRADEWASRCGMHETASVIRNVSKCTLTEEQIKELKWEKKRNVVVEFCTSTARYMKRKFKWDGDQWQATSGSLYHLTSHASALTCGTTVTRMPERSLSGRSEEDTVRCIEARNRGEDVLTVELFNCGNNKIKQTITQRCHEKPKNIYPETSTSSNSKEIPEVKYFYSSPVKKQKKQKNVVDKNYLQVPLRPKKKKNAD